MKIDRAAFLATTAALWAAGCPSAPQQPAQVAAVSIPEPPAASASSPPAASAKPVAVASSAPAVVDASAPTSDPPVAGDCSADNVGALASACSRLHVDPTCESASSYVPECNTLREPNGDGFKPRIAEQVADCVAKVSLRPPHCRWNIGRCIRNAVDGVCVEPAMRQKCTELLADCNKRHKRVRYTQEQCEKILSSVTGTTRRDAIQALSPMNEGCVLDFVLPYYPYDRQTWP